MSKLRLIKFEVLENYGSTGWAIINTTTENLHRSTFDNELDALLFLAYHQGNTRFYDQEEAQIAHSLRVWLDEIAPRSQSRFTNREHMISAVWAKDLVDTSYWDEESLLREPELSEEDLIELLNDSKRGDEVSKYLLDQFVEWESLQAKAKRG